MVTYLSEKSKTGTFSHRLRLRAQTARSWLCVGLDPEIEKLPAGYQNIDGIVRFCDVIVRATSHRAAAYKLNFAFYEQLGEASWQVLAAVRALIPDEIPVIADAKRGDIGNTSAAYARAIFDVHGFDAVTVNPYLGWDALQPFLDRDGVGAIVLCRTSNPGSSVVQEMDVNGVPLYMRIAQQAMELDCKADVGLVVGATQPEALRAVRHLSEDVVLLLPGIGAQGAGVTDAIRAGANASGQNALLSASREILYASHGEDFVAAAGAAADRIANESWIGPTPEDSIAPTHGHS